MNRRYIVSILIATALLSIVVCTLNLGKKLEAQQPKSVFMGFEDIDNGSGSDDEMDGDNDEDVYEYVPIEIPAAVRELQPDGNWYADTICVAGNKTYYFAYIEDMPGSVIYVDDKVLIESSNLEMFPDENNPQKFYIQVGTRNIDVVFSDPKSVAQLSGLTSQYADFERFRTYRVADFGNKILYSLEADYPKPSVTNSQEITRWLTDVMLASVTPKKKRSINANYYRYENVNTIGSQYKGGTENKDALADFLARFYFNTVKKEYGSDFEDYPIELFSNLSLRVDQCNKRFVTYQAYTNDHYGGAHGYYTVRLISYDHVHHQEIGWTYLFKPQSFDAILKLIDTEARKDKSFIYWDGDIQNAVEAIDDDGYLTGEKVLPDLGLGQSGVVFSFQPYSVACFAAGTFHFTVPYNKLEPYFTDRAKWCLHP